MTERRAGPTTGQRVRAAKRPRYQVLSPVEEQTLPPQVLQILKKHVGRLNVITARDLAAQLGRHGRYDDRKVRAAIALLRKDGRLIGATFAKPPGFFMLMSEAEWRDYLGDLRSRVLQIWSTYDDVARSGQREYGVALAQMKLEL